MSTKIYTGFRFRDRSWKAAHEHVMAFRRELAILVHDHESRQVACRACTLFDRQTLGIEPAGDKSPYVAASLEFMEASQKERLTFDLSLFPYGDRIYGITFGLPTHEELWLSKPFIERWGYWNNTDRPDDVTGREWGVRRRTWDKILVGYASPAMSGFTAKCIARYGDAVRIGDVMKRLPTLAERAKDQAVDAAFRERASQTTENAMTTWNWLRSEEGQQRIAAEAKRIRPALVRRISAKQLNPD